MYIKVTIKQLLCIVSIFCMSCFTVVQAADTIKVGLNYPKTGPYSVQGTDQWRAANLAKDEINASGGIMGKQVEIVWRDSKSNSKST